MPKIPPRKVGRTYQTEGQLVSRWVHDKLEANELLAYQKKALTNIELQRELLSRFPSNMSLRYRFKSYKATIGTYRKRFNEMKLYSAQPEPFLASFQYDEVGYIVMGGIYQTTYLMFEECYQRCVDLKIADPRFVPPEYITELRNRKIEQLTTKKYTGTNWLEWIVPDEDTIKGLKIRLKLKELYNSVRFPKGCTREETPEGFEA